MNNFIQLENSLIGQFCTTAEKVADKIHNINQNLGKSYKEILADAKAKVSAEMSAEEYKEFITEKISQTPRHFSRYKDDATVVISDEGLAAMQNNPDYEAKVLNHIAEEMNFPDYLCFYPGNNGRVETFQFGATAEEYRGTSYGKSSRQPVSNEKSYWELRLERLKKRLEAEEKYLLERQQLEEIGEKIAQRRIAQNLTIGLDGEVKPQMPITGVPASLLLSLL